MKKTAAALTPTTFNQWMQLADTLAKSSLVPKDFRDKPSDCLVAMQMGASVGLNPFQAIQSIAVINGKPCMYGDAVLGIVYASGLIEDIEETDDGQAAICTAKRKGKPTPTVRTFSMKMATDAKVYEKDGQGGGKWISLSERAVWRSYPARMRQMRARSWALRDTFPDVLKGLAVREEVEDYGDPEPGEPKNITPPRTPDDMALELMPREKGVAVLSDTLVKPAVVVKSIDQPTPKETVAKENPDIPASMIPDILAAKAEFESGQGEPYRFGVLTDAEVKPAAPGQDPPSQATPKTVFTVGTQRFETNGINRAQMMELFKLYPRVAKKYGQEKAADVLKNEFHLEHRADLTEEQAERYTIRLKEMLEG